MNDYEGVLPDRTDEIAALHLEIFGPAEPSRQKRATPGPVSNADDAAIIERLLRSRYAPLWSGDTSGYDDDDSAADLALAGYFYSQVGDDTLRVERLMRQGGLARPKWDERRGSGTWLDLTLDQASDAADRYRPPSAWPSFVATSAPDGSTNGCHDPESGSDGDASSASDCLAEVERLRGLLAERDRIIVVQQGIISTQRSEIDELQATIRGTLDVFANPNLRGAEKLTAVKSAFLLHERDSHGEPVLPGAAAPHKRVYLPKLSEDLGQSAATTSRHLGTLAASEAAPFAKTTKTVQTRQGPRTVVEVEARAPVLSETLRTIAAYEPPARPTHGGRRWPTCPYHPVAVVAERTSWICTECGTVLGESESLHVQDGGLEEDSHAAEDVGCVAVVSLDDQDGGLEESAADAVAAPSPALDVHLERLGEVPAPDPRVGWVQDGYCSIHRRQLTYREALAEECSSCRPVYQPLNGHTARVPVEAAGAPQSLRLL